MGLRVVRKNHTRHTMLRLLMLAPALAGAIELTQANWDEKTAGKSVFVKFLAPW